MCIRDRIEEYGPTINESLGWMACSKRNVVESGDHFVIFGNVDKISSLESKRSPLIFWSGKFENLK